MDEKKKSFLNVSSFSKEKGAIAHFLFYCLIGYIGVSFISPILDGRFRWYTVVTSLIVFAYFAGLYFISRFLAYRTKVFPKLSSREAFHARCFLILTLLSFLIFVSVIIILITMNRFTRFCDIRFINLNIYH